MALAVTNWPMGQWKYLYVMYLRCRELLHGDGTDRLYSNMTDICLSPTVGCFCLAFSASGISGMRLVFGSIDWDGTCRRPNPALPTSRRSVADAPLPAALGSKRGEVTASQDLFRSYNCI